jgi:hypothetical protein
MSLIQAPQRSAAINLAVAARLIPSVRGEKHVHPATLTRWILRGIRLRDGAILKLVAQRFPGGWVTTREDLDAFVGRLTRDRCGEPTLAVPASSAPRTPSASRASAALDLMGL